MLVATFIPCYKLDTWLEDVKPYYPNVSVISKSFKEHGQVNVRNEGIKSLSNYDYVWTVDADEIILKDDQEKILSKVKGHDSIFIPVLHYADSDHIYEMSDHRPVVLVNPNKVEFYETRCIRFECPLHIDDVYLHHLGFIHSKELMDWKKANYWNTGNKKEPDQIMSRKKIPYDTPKEVKDIIRRKIVNI